MLMRNSSLESRLVCLACNFLLKCLRFLPFCGARFSVKHIDIFLVIYARGYVMWMKSILRQLDCS